MIETRNFRACYQRIDRIRLQSSTGLCVRTVGIYDHHSWWSLVIVVGVVSPSKLAVLETIATQSCRNLLLLRVRHSSRFRGTMQRWIVQLMQAPYRTKSHRLFRRSILFVGVSVPFGNWLLSSRPFQIPSATFSDGRKAWLNYRNIEFRKHRGILRNWNFFFIISTWINRLIKRPIILIILICFLFQVSRTDLCHKNTASTEEASSIIIQ